MSDYKHTVALPQTDFAMREVEHEEGIREFWRLAGTYDRMASTPDQPTHDGGRHRFRLHDGPPYANGDIHMGHALNKILKDFVVRSQYIMGNAVEYVPGWDCHGLPIETQVEKNLLEEGRSKADLTTVEFRALCRDYAEVQIQKQMEQFKALGVGADWQNRYATKDFSSEGKILRAFLDLVETGYVYAGFKPVMWSQVEGTSLAEAETNHKDIKTSQCWVRFPVIGAQNDLEGLSMLVWTTTPWTLPANRCLASNSKIKYVILRVLSATNPLMREGELLVLAEARINDTMAELGVTKWEIHPDNVDPRFLRGFHPLREDGYMEPINVYHADFVTDTAGTGIVHIAPEHGPEDYQLWQSLNRGGFEPTLDDQCRYVEGTPLFAGEQILNPTPKGEYIFDFTNAKVTRAMEARGTLALASKQVQSLPHSWRSHTPLIYRATDQWFININTRPDGFLNQPVKDDVLETSKGVQFIPEAGRARFEAAVGGRPDWLVSRQRVWGTPLCLFVHKETGEVLKDEDINEFIVEQVAALGGDVWWTRHKSFWFDESNDSLNPDDFDQVFDVLDVWFDSGCTYDLVPSLGPGQPASLYLEGSDQHRGWFQSSALVGMARDHHLPFKAVLTHGFVLDHKGEKMSKSKGNVVDPREKAEQFGTDVLRYWVASSDYTTDLRVGDEILKTAQEAYRKVRNTFRYLLAASSSRSDLLSDTLTELSPLDWHILFRLREIQTEVVAAYKEFNFKEAVRVLSDFMSKELSSFYFDVNKDILYCDAMDSQRRQAYTYTLYHVLHELMVLWSPIIPHTVEEMGQGMIDGKSVLLYVALAGVRWERKDAETTLDWSKVFEVINAVNLAVEKERRSEGGLQNLLDMNITVWASPDHKIAFEQLDVAQILRCSQGAIYFSTAEPGTIGVEIARAEGRKCARSRLVLPEVGTDPEYPDLTLRDADAVRKWKALNA